MAPTSEGVNEDAKKLAEKLRVLREHPSSQDSTELFADAMLYLLKESKENETHWFCSKASKLRRECATFLMILFVYPEDSDGCIHHREGLKKQLLQCVDCVQGFQQAKVDSFQTYLSSVPSGHTKQIMDAENQWEVNHVFTSLASCPSASDVPKAVLLHLLSNPAITLHERISPILLSRLTPKADLPHRPSGVLLLLFHNNRHVRQWAHERAKASKIDFKLSYVSQQYHKVVEQLVNFVSHLKESEQSTDPKATLDSSPLVKNAVAFWQAFLLLVKSIGLECKVNGKDTKATTLVINTILGHLHDSDNCFPHILQCFLAALEQLTDTPDSIWQIASLSSLNNHAAPNTPSPSIIFDAIKDNSSYLKLFEKEATEGQSSSWTLAWFPQFLLCIAPPKQKEGSQSFSDVAFTDILAKMSAFCFEELQHSRFKLTSAKTMQTMLKTLFSLMKTYLECNPDEEYSVRKQGAVKSVIERHSDTILSIAFSRDYIDLSDDWSAARQAARNLVWSLLRNDRSLVSKAVLSLTALLPGKPLDAKSRAILSRHSDIQPRLWKKIYSNIVLSDHEALRTVSSVLAEVCLYDNFNLLAYKHSQPEVHSLISSSLRAINLYLRETREGFPELCTKFADFSSPSSLSSFLGEPSVVRNFTSLMLSPVEELQTAAMAVVGQAFDVDVRVDCIRSLLQQLPEQTLGGVQYCVTQFNMLVNSLPELCGFAQSLVRGLTDVCDVLCNQPDGLLFNVQVRGKIVGEGREATIAELWRLMTSAIGHIFTRTPSWSSYYPNGVMIVWMRDALIFARGLVEQRRIMQSAVTAIDQNMTGLTPKKLSRKAVQMVDDLQNVLTGSIKWLRLTDMELLHQSFKLIEVLFEAFEHSNVQPSKEAMTKLESAVTQAQKSYSTPNADQRSRLTNAELSWLLSKLDQFNDADEVQIISPPKDAKTKKQHNITTSAKPLPLPSLDLKEKEKKKGIVQPIPIPAAQPKFKKATQKPLGRPPPNDKLASLKPLPEPIPAGPEWTDPGFQSGPRTSKAAAQSSDDSDSDDSNSADGGGLAALNKFQKSPEKKKERRTIKMLDGPVQIGKGLQKHINQLERRHVDAQRTTRRLKPDITSLHKLILSWDYDHSGDEPPGFSATRDGLRKVPKTFTTAEEYISVFEPLLHLECWKQLVKAKDEPLDVISCRVNGKSFVDSWIDVEISIAQLPFGWFLSETDIVLLRRERDGPALLAKVQSARKTAKETSATLRCHNVLPNQMEPPGLDSQFLLTKVLSLSTVHREYAALVALEYYDMCPQVLQAQLSIIKEPPMADIERAMLAHKVNEPQAKAILCALSATGFALIQGPPGTGKTWTICGMVGAFMSTRSNVPIAVQVGKPSAPVDKPLKKKLLLCAPSNAAIDEVAKRIQDGVLDSTGQLVVPNIVRIGTEASVNVSAKDIHLDSIVDKMLAGNGMEYTSVSELEISMANTRKELDSVKVIREQKQKELDQCRGNDTRVAELEKEITKLHAERQRLSLSLNKLRDDKNRTSRNNDAERRRIRLDVLHDADVICSTLSGAGHDSLEQFEFETVIIDEAAQAIEISSLIPLKYRCTRCILVGDPKQLPPTVLSPVATSYNYNHSLFSRLEQMRPNAIHLLSIQYRMHPDISRLPSMLFYGGRLHDGPDMMNKTSQLWHSSEDFKPYKFFDVRDGHEESAAYGFSLVNKAECETAMSLYNRLRLEHNGVDFDFRIGIISMYRAQVAEMKRVFKRRFGEDIVGKIDFNTVDGFQGQEKDIIILSCVRGGPQVTSVGFLRDERRMNVSMTRSRSSLFILGHAATLERSDAMWKQIVHDARERNCLVSANVAYFSRPANARPPMVITKGIAKQPSKKSPPKASPKRTAVPVVIPDGLVTPSALKGSAGKMNTSQAYGRITPMERLASDQEEKNHFPSAQAGPSRRSPSPRSRMQGVESHSRNNSGDVGNSRNQDSVKRAEDRPVKATTEKRSSSDHPVPLRALKRKKPEAAMFIPKARTSQNPPRKHDLPRKPDDGTHNVIYERPSDTSPQQKQ